MDVLWSSRNRMSNLVGNVVNINTGDWVRRDSGVGAGIDSYYEYVAKAYVLLGEEKYLNRWNTHYSAVMKYLGQVSWGQNSFLKLCRKSNFLLWNATLKIFSLRQMHRFSLGSFTSRCPYAPTSFDLETFCGRPCSLLAWTSGLNGWPQAGHRESRGSLSNRSEAQFHSRGFYHGLPGMWWCSKSHSRFLQLTFCERNQISFLLNNYQHFQVHWGQHLLRPEFVESTYFLYRATGDQYYLDVGKKVLKSLQRHARVMCGYATIRVYFCCQSYLYFCLCCKTDII